MDHRRYQKSVGMGDIQRFRLKCFTVRGAAQWQKLAVPKSVR